MTKIEKLLRSDYTLHFLMMFFVISVLMYLIEFPLWLLILWVVIPPIAWEVYRKQKRKIPVDVMDIVMSIAGGFLAIAI